MGRRESGDSYERRFKPGYDSPGGPAHRGHLGHPGHDPGITFIRNTGLRTVLDYWNMQNPPAELTHLIEPIEAYVVDRLAQSIATQAAVIAEIQARVAGGQSACGTIPLFRFHRLVAYHKQLLDLHTAVGKVGEGLHQWSKVDPAGWEPEEEIPF